MPSHSQNIPGSHACFSCTYYLFPLSGISFTFFPSLSRCSSYITSSVEPFQSLPQSPLSQLNVFPFLCSPALCTSSQCIVQLTCHVHRFRIPEFSGSGGYITCRYRRLTVSFYLRVLSTCGLWCPQWVLESILCRY